jgi:hypothetical protein
MQGNSTILIANLALALLASRPCSLILCTLLSEINEAIKIPRKLSGKKALLRGSFANNEPNRRILNVQIRECTPVSEIKVSSFFRDNPIAA